MSELNRQRAAFSAMLERYKNGTATPAEKDFIEKYFERFESEPDVLDGFSKAEREGLQQEIQEKLHASMKQSTGAKVKALPRFRKWQVAASVILFLSLIGITYMTTNRKNKQLDTGLVKEQPVKNDIIPGGSRAVLTLGDNSQIILDDVKNGMIAEQGRTSILKTGDGQIAYNAEDGTDETVAYNTLTTPVAGQYKLALPDGSIVWLNASSSLHFPARFSARERRVRLTGEGYFEVKHNEAWPFIVEVEGMEVHDLGTEFNINAYPDETGIQTTLVNGLASVKNAGETVVLQPGKAAIVNAENTSVKNVDIAITTAWKNGMFLFKDTDIKTIMRQVARWYDAEINYKGNVPDLFNGEIPRSVNVSELLKLLELTNRVHFVIEGKKITVTP